jgi:chemotaxis protein methyltransferase CheR
LDCRILASDADANLLRRAQVAHYRFSSLRELPTAWRRRAFVPEGDGYCLKAEYRQGVRFECQDLLHQCPCSPFDLILCRNLVFTYFNESLQLGILNRLVGLIHQGGALLIGNHERLPPNSALMPWPGVRNSFQKVLPGSR